jgi:hypothetical protein
MTSKALGALMLSGLFFAGPAVAQQGSPPPGGSPSSPAQPGTPGAPSSGTPTDTSKTPTQQGKSSKGKTHKKSSLKPCAPGTMSTAEAPCRPTSGTTK